MSKKEASQVNSYSDTIFALASGRGRAGVAIMRISGGKAAQTLKNITRRDLPKPRNAVVRKLYNSAGEKIDEALVLLFKNPKSFTGEDMTELHIHGGGAVIEAVAQELFALGLRQAEAGEFTRRAFQNGKVDLTEAEGLADLIDAKSEGQRKQALRQMQGGLRGVYEGWRSRVIDSLVCIEGEIDFPDETDVPDSLSRKAGPGLKSLAEDLRASIAASARGEHVRHGIDIAIIGAPNVGKSSIINRLARKKAAIVSATAGTTRDIVEVQMQISGMSVRFSDTAGLRDTQDEIEAEGVRRALKRAQEADLRLAVIESGSVLGQELAKQLKAKDFLAYNKSDIVNSVEMEDNVSRETFCISAKTGAGFPALEEALEASILERFGATELPGLTRSRHTKCVQEALVHMEKAQTNLLIAPELAGADLHQALHALKELAGETDIEAVLDRVFSSFCIGK